VPALSSAERPQEPESLRPRPSYEPPRTPSEKTLADLLERLLETGPVGRRDSFPALGGHSLLALQVMAHINEAFGTALPIRELYERPDLEALAAAVTESWSEPVAAEVTQGD
jgi:acyl carrier protein